MRVDYTLTCNVLSINSNYNDEQFHPLFLTQLLSASKHVLSFWGTVVIIRTTPPASAFSNSAFSQKMWFSEETAIFSLNSIYQLIFVIETCCVLFEVRTELLILFRRISCFWRLISKNQTLLRHYWKKVYIYIQPVTAAGIVSSDNKGSGQGTDSRQPTRNTGNLDK
jgi:hypothetical protein